MNIIKPTTEAATVKENEDGSAITIERTESTKAAGQELSAFIVDALNLDTAKNNELVRLITRYTQEVERGAFAGGVLWALAPNGRENSPTKGERHIKLLQ